MHINGNCWMLQDNAKINVMAMSTWNSGSSLNVTAYNSIYQCLRKLEF